MSDYKLYGQDAPTITAGGYRYALIAARFNDFIVDELLKGAIDALYECGASESQLTVARVPGAFELPLACQKFAQTGQYDAIIALGCVIRGGTPHFEYVCSESARGLNEVGLKYDLPVINGILTTDNIEQARERIDTATDNNKGVDAAKAAMEVLALYAGLAQPK